jgi:hypothetical protein
MNSDAAFIRKTDYVFVPVRDFAAAGAFYGTTLDGGRRDRFAQCSSFVVRAESCSTHLRGRARAPAQPLGGGVLAEVGEYDDLALAVIAVERPRPVAGA